jgi:glycosyltransferase involved in cell wall biosynthesis
LRRMIARQDRGFVVAIVIGEVDPVIDDPDALLARYHGRRGWADAVADAGADVVAVVQRFGKNHLLRRGSVDHHFVAGDLGDSATFWGTRVVSAVRALDPDVVHVDGLVFPALVLHLRATLPRRTAIVVQDHGGIHARSPLFRSHAKILWYAAGLRRADGFLFTAREQAVPWQKARILARTQPVYEVPESSSDLAPPAGVTGPIPSLPGRPALLWVGRLNANKDPLTVLRGFEAAVLKLPEAELTLVYGDDELLPEVRSKIEGSAVLRARVHLRGRVHRDELPALYSGAEVFVLGSHHEGSGYALLEALSFGVTPVVTDIPPFRALTDGGRMGALFPPEGVPELARALERFDYEGGSARREAVRTYFERELSWSAVGRRALEVYRLATSSRRAR